MAEMSEDTEFDPENDMFDDEPSSPPVVEKSEALHPRTVSGEDSNSVDSVDKQIQNDKQDVEDSEEEDEEDEKYDDDDEEDDENMDGNELLRP